jgi:hypothetical protein
MKTKSILMGCGAAVVAVMPYTWPLFSPHHYALYHSLHSLDNMIWAALLDFIVIGVLAALFFYYWKRRGRIDRSVIWALVVVRLLRDWLRNQPGSGSPEVRQPSSNSRTASKPRMSWRRSRSSHLHLPVSCSHVPASGHRSLAHPLLEYR